MGLELSNFLCLGSSMTLITLLLVLVLEFHFKIGSQYRNFQWFIRCQEYLKDRLSSNAYFESWGGIATILILPLILVLLFLSLFEGNLYWILTFIVSFIILFLCIGPMTIEKSFEK